MTPREFIAEYVHPSIELFTENQQSKHLAIHAISQLDILAEVVANHLGEIPKNYAIASVKAIPF